jgi:hypothetical protein
MLCKMISLSLFLLLSLGGFATPSSEHSLSNYPNLHGNPLLNHQMRTHIAPYLLPLDHPMKPVLDAIFSQSRVVESEQSLVNAGFEWIAGPMPFSYIIVVRHPMVPGYVFKLYLDSEIRSRKEIPHLTWLARRCAGARGIKKIIERHNLRRFSVPDKWLYILPPHSFFTTLQSEAVVLIETDMQPESHEVSKRMWQTAITRKHLDELYLILKEGYGGNGTISLFCNVPFTKRGVFAFTDTEDPRQCIEPKLKHVKKYISKEMQAYWDKLIN